jgi:translation elongation factor EF-1alpha
VFEIEPSTLEPEESGVVTLKTHTSLVLEEFKKSPNMGRFFGMVNYKVVLTGEVLELK